MRPYMYSFWCSSTVSNIQNVHQLSYQDFKPSIFCWLAQKGQLMIPCWPKGLERNERIEILVS